MANEDVTYADLLAALQNEVLQFLRTFESVQENLRPGILAENQAQMVSAVGGTFRRFESMRAPERKSLTKQQSDRPVAPE